MSRSPLTLTCHLCYYDLTGIQFTYYLLATIWCYVQRTFIPNALLGNTECLPGYTVYYFMYILYLQSSSIPLKCHALIFVYVCTLVILIDYAKPAYAS